MFQLKFGSYVVKPPKVSILELANGSDEDFCYGVLHKVSRSFAVVIQQLDQELSLPVCVFYLVLRGLDSVEDDMDFPIEKKLVLLRSFHEKLDDMDWCIQDCGDSADYRAMMSVFYKISRVFATLKPEYQEVIRDITLRMGAGMAEFAEAVQKTGKGSVVSKKDYDLYCHYVAGLVGIGLSNLFSVSGLESPKVANNTTLSNNMGLFLQKTNIIRDYLEDLDSSRTWWPEEIWSEYAPELEWFGKNPDHEKSVACLNHLVLDALSLVPDVMQYLETLKSDSVFKFCAIPQVMAIATLAEVYDNKNIFKGVVKIRKGLSAKLMLNSGSLDAVKATFHAGLSTIRSKAASKLGKCPAEEAILAKTIEIADRMLAITETPATSSFSTGALLFATGSVVAAVSIGVLAARR